MKKLYPLRGRRRQRGLTLVELMIAIGIAAVVMFGVFRFASTAMARHRASDQAKVLGAMSHDLRVKFNAVSNFTGLNNAMMANLGVVPNSMVKTTTTTVGSTSTSSTDIISGWGTSITVAAGTLNTIADSAMSFTYKVPGDECVDFVLNAESNFAEITVGATKVKSTTTPDISLPNLNTACGNGAKAHRDIIFLAGR